MVKLYDFTISGVWPVIRVANMDIAITEVIVVVIEK
jgi:hypothetical protein